MSTQDQLLRHPNLYMVTRSYLRRRAASSETPKENAEKGTVKALNL